MLKLLSRIFILCIAFLASAAFMPTEDKAGDNPASPDPSPVRFPYAVEPMRGIVQVDSMVKAGLLYDAEQGKIVWEKQLRNAFPVASLTKMMVALLVAEDLKAGKISWGTVVTGTKEAALTSGTRIYLRPGEMFTVHELLKSSLISSANDACYLLAQHLGGTEQEFVARMNSRVAELGMCHTCFFNSTGLPCRNRTPDNFSTPADLLILTMELLKHPEVASLSGRTDESIRSGSEKLGLKNHNKLAAEYPEVDGLKTGFTVKAGFCISATALKGNRRVIAIALGAPTQNVRNNFVAGMLNTYFNDVLCMSKLGDTSCVKMDEVPAVMPQNRPLNTNSSGYEKP